MNIIQTARNHVGNGAAMESSARLYLKSAILHQKQGNWHQADMHAVRSLSYSIGISHPDYRKAWAKIRGTEDVKIPSTIDFMEAVEADENAPVGSVPRYINQVTDMGVTSPLSRSIRVF